MGQLTGASCSYVVARVRCPDTDRALSEDCPVLLTETPKPGSPDLAHVSCVFVGSNRLAVQAAAQAAGNDSL